MKKFTIILILLLISCFSGCKVEEEAIVYEGKAVKEPWPGWWWPYKDNGGPNLYEDGADGGPGPLGKYDIYRTEVLGHMDADSKTREFEEVRLIEGENWGGHRLKDNYPKDYHGHCDGLAVASIIEDEPTESIVHNGIEFTVGDLKGLLTEFHTGYKCTEKDKNPITNMEAHEFHKTLIDWVGAQKAVIIDISPGETVNNKPVYKYKMEYDGNLFSQNVKCTIWYKDYVEENDLNYVQKSEDIKEGDEYKYTARKTYSYFLRGGKRNPSSGDWKDDSIEDHPDYMMCPKKCDSYPPLGHDMFVSYKVLKKIYPPLK